MDTNYATHNQLPLNSGDRATIVGDDGTSFTGLCIGTCVSKGVLYVAFEDVEGVPAKGKRRFHNIPRSSMVTPPPAVLGVR